MAAIKGCRRYNGVPALVTASRTQEITMLNSLMSAGCRRLMQCDWHYATGEKSYFKVNSLTTATRDSRFFQIFFSPLGLSP
jgi:hypothetical protein